MTIITNNLNLPQPLVDAVTRDYKYTDKRYSVTQLLKGVREAILERRHSDEIEQDVSDMIWLIFGTAVHSILENAQETDTQIKENKLIQPIESGYELSGIFDLYDDATGTVTDYKTASVWKVIYNEWDDYRQQVLMYCWMLDKMGFRARRGEIVALLKDHSKSKAEHDASYPQHPVHKVSWNVTDEDIAEIEKFIIDRFAEIQAAEQLPDDELPLCTKEERWGKDDTWAVKKVGNKKASKVLYSLEDAEKHVKYLEDTTNGKYEIEFRPGEDQKCMKYCSANQFCSHYYEIVGDE